MNFEPLDLSVVIPTFNRPGYLVEAVESTLRQTRPAREIIVVDDGSSDETRSAVERFGSAIRYHRQENAGQQAARNLGAQLAQGKWFSTLDDDDRYVTSYVETVGRVIDASPVEIIYANHRDFDDRGPARRTQFEGLPSGYWEGLDTSGEWSVFEHFPVERFLKRIAVFPSSMTTNKDFYSGIGGYDQRLRGVKAEDVEFLVRACLAGSVAIIWTPLVDYRIHDGNEGKSNDLTALGRLHIFEMIYREHQLTPAFKTALEANLPERRGNAIDHAYRARQFGLLHEIARQVAPEHWTASRRIKQVIAKLGSPTGSAIADVKDGIFDAVSSLSGRKK